MDTRNPRFSSLLQATFLDDKNDLEAFQLYLERMIHPSVLYHASPDTYWLLADRATSRAPMTWVSDTDVLGDMQRYGLACTMQAGRWFLFALFSTPVLFAAAAVTLPAARAFTEGHVAALGAVAQGLENTLREELRAHCHGDSGCPGLGLGRATVEWLTRVVVGYALADLWTHLYTAAATVTFDFQQQRGLILARLAEEDEDGIPDENLKVGRDAKPVLLLFFSFHCPIIAPLRAASGCPIIPLSPPLDTLASSRLPPRGCGRLWSGISSTGCTWIRWAPPSAVASDIPSPTAPISVP